MQRLVGLTKLCQLLSGPEPENFRLQCVEFHAAWLTPTVDLCDGCNDVLLGLLYISNAGVFVQLRVIGKTMYADAPVINYEVPD